MTTPKFYIVSTPIGNLDDITLRALSVLKSVDLILCEDTRVSNKLLSHFSIDTKTQSYHANSKLSKIDYVEELLLQGKTIALISDAGTPIISDPGILLVQELYKRIKNINIVPVPGASALLSALVISGINTSEFTFLGFLPHKKGRETLFKEIAKTQRAFVFYESVHRLEKTLDSLAKNLDEGRTMCVLKELTKIYEERVFGTAQEIRDYFKNNKDKIRGEFVIVISSK